MLIALVALAARPAAAQVAREYAEVHMAMRVRIVLHAADDSTARDAARAAFRSIADLENTFSDYRDHSELRSLEARAGEWITVSAPLFHVIALALDVARATDGAFDPTVAPLVALWRRARAAGVLPDAASLHEARRLVDWRLVRLDTTARAVMLPRHGMGLDLGGIAKGYILQTALDTLRQRGAPAALIQAGGDIVAGDPPPGRQGWRIDTPGADPGFHALARALANAALATSGPDFQFLEVGGVRYSHVIDPRSGEAVTAPAAVRVIARDAALADALATALSVTGPGAARTISRRFDGVLVDVGRVGAVR